MVTEWTGAKAKIGGRLLNSPLRRISDIFFFGNIMPFVNRVLKETIKGNETVLDVGAGSGYFSLNIARKLSTGKVICLDASEDMLAHLLRKAKNKGLESKIELLRHDAISSGLPNESVDVVISGAVLHELVNPGAAIAEMYRVLKPKGDLIIADLRITHAGHHQDSHGPFSVSQIETLFSDAGFIDISAQIIRRWILATARKR
ncbi:MAG: class I SAM-dependent methyltransferase [bacterium]